MHYVKLWDSILESSISDEQVHVRWLWVVCLLRANQYGQVYGVPSALARLANLTVEQTQDALAILTAPDPNSNSPEDEGRRLVKLEGNLWQVVNYQKYRTLRNPEQVREKTRVRVQRYRARKAESPVTQDGNAVTLGNEVSNDEVTLGNPIVVGSRYEVVGTTKTDTRARVAKRKDEYPDDFSMFWDAYPRKEGKQPAFKAWQATTQARPPLSELITRLIEAKGSASWIKDGGQFIPHASTWLNQHRWEDVIAPARKGAGWTGVIAAKRTTCEYCGVKLQEEQQSLGLCGNCTAAHFGGHSDDPND